MPAAQVRRQAREVSASPGHPRSEWARHLLWTRTTHRSIPKEYPMPAAKKSASKTASKSSKSGGDDAISLLTADHKEVKALFKDYEKLVKEEADDEEKQAL